MCLKVKLKVKILKNCIIPGLDKTPNVNTAVIQYTNNSTASTNTLAALSHPCKTDTEHTIYIPRKGILQASLYTTPNNECHSA